MLLLYYVAIFIFHVLGLFSRQRYAKISKGNLGIYVYSLVTGVIAMTVFFIASGFDLNFNIRTCMYGFAYSVIVFLSYFFSLAVFRFMGVAESGFITAGLSLGITVLSSLFFFDEAITLTTAVQLLLTLLTFLIIFLQNRNINKEPAKKSVTTVGVLLCVGSAMVGALGGTISKAFAVDTAVTDDNSFFFITNVYTTIFSLIGLMVTSKCSVKSFLGSLKTISKEGYLMVILNTLASNMMSLLTVAILSLGELVIFTPLNSALGLIAAEVVAVFIAKEKPRVLATIVAIFSVIVVFF